MRFYLDEDIDHFVQKRLAEASVDVLTVQYAKMRGRDDAEQLAFAVKEQRVLVTADEDFIGVARKTRTHCGIIYAYAEAIKPPALVEYLLTLHNTMRHEDIANRLIVIGRVQSPQSGS